MPESSGGGAASSLISLGTFHHEQGEHDEALRYYKKSLSIQREIGNAMDESLCLNNIGVVHLERGELGDALTNFEQALRLREESNSVYELGETLFNLGETSSGFGQYDRALGYYLRALERMRSVQDDLGVTAALHGIGIILGRQGRPAVGAMAPGPGWIVRGSAHLPWLSSWDTL